MKHLVLVSVLSVLAVAAQAEVTDSAENGFTTVHEVVIDADRAATWAAAVGERWSDDHTITGDAGNMSIRARPQGCFCERLGNNGGVVHLTVTFVNPGTLLRLTGGLGPLGLMGVDGNMTWEFFDGEGGTRVKFAYAVGGYRPGGLGAIAIPVDYVIGEALQRLKAHVETGEAEQAQVE
jgi:hypothetical protein